MHLKMDHAVLVVGSGKTTLGLDYFIVKNSFSDKWGEKGFVRIAASGQPVGGDGVCGILNALY